MLFTLKKEFYDGHGQLFTPDLAFVCLPVVECIASYGINQHYSLYQIMGPADGSKHRFAGVNISISSTQLDAVEGDAPITNKQVQRISDYFPCPSMLGEQVLTMPVLDRNGRHKEGILSGEKKGTFIEGNHLELYDAAFVNPYTERSVGKIVTDYTSFGGYGKGQLVELLKGPSNRYYVVSTKVRGRSLTTSEVNILNGDFELLRKKVNRVRQTTVSEKFQELLTYCSNDGVVNTMKTLLLPVEQQNGDQFYYMADRPDYVDIDPTDITKLTALDSSKAEACLAKGEDPYTSTSRYSLSPAKMLMRFFHKDIFNNHHYEQANNSLAAAMQEMLMPEEGRPEMVIVEGKDIRTYYDGAMYHNARGSLANSCMRYSKCGTFFGLYVENPQAVKMLIVRDRESGKIHGRALLWYNGDQKYVDRRYANSEVEETRMLRWAEKQGFQNLWATRDSNPCGNVVVDLPVAYQSHFPYMDSMCYLSTTEGKIANHKVNKTYGQMRSTGGDWNPSPEDQQCAGSSRWATKAKMVKLRSADYALPEHAVTLNYEEGHELKKNAVVDTLSGGYNAKAESIALVIGKKKANTHKGNPAVCFVVSKGTWHRTQDCVLSVLDKGYILKEEAVQMPDGKYCSAAKAEEYRMLLRKRAVNKAHRVVAEEQVVVAA